MHPPPAATGVAVEQVEAAVLVKSAAFAPVTLGLDVKVSCPVPVFSNVTVVAALVVPSGCGPNGTLAGRLTAGAVPVPVSGTVWGLGVALSARLREALSAPEVVGLKVTVTMQVVPGATDTAVEQVVEPATITKSIAFVPVIDGLLAKFRALEPMFVSVTVIPALVIPSTTWPNGTFPGRPLTPGPGAVPVPDSPTVCVAGVALSLKLSIALSAPVVDGVNVSVTVQLIPAGTGVPKIHAEALDEEETMAKSDALVPMTDGLLLNVSDCAPEFVRVTTL